MITWVGLRFAFDPTGEKHRKNYVWRCKCRCGNIVALPATRLLSGNTLSCGCTKAENILSVSKYIGGTHLVLSLKEDEKKPDTLSGYPGVCRHRDKWAARIAYRKIAYQLGSYKSIDDAIAARKEAEQKRKKDPRSFVEQQGLKKELCV